MTGRVPLLDTDVRVQAGPAGWVVCGRAGTVAEAEADAAQVRAALQIQQRLTGMLAALRVAERDCIGSSNGAAAAVGIVLRSLLGTLTTDTPATVLEAECRAG